MKMTLLVQTWARGIRKTLALGTALLFCAVAPTTRAAAATDLLEKGIYTEETKGDLQVATQIYQQIVDDPAAERSLVAQAQLRLGLCQLKLGNKPQAIFALDRLTHEFPDKDKLLAMVEKAMPQLLDELVQQIERNYIQEVDRGELMETAIRAIVGKLDSRGGFLRTNDMEFLSVNELTELNVNIEQKIAGIGAVLKVEDGEVVVRRPLPGSPALEGGLRAEDRIVTIDGTELPRNNLATAIKLMRGPVGTAITIGVKRSGSDDLREIKLIRDTIQLPSISGDRRKADSTWDFLLDEQRKIGYIRLTYIGKQSAEEMHTALDDLKGRGLKALILDLRNAPGGLLDGAVAIADLFVESGRIVTVKGRNGETIYEARPEGTFTGFPIALLANRNTASAAEIVAACLQDHHRAVVIGERTFGQGIVRSLFQLKSGVGAVKLPVAAYYRPSGKSVNRFPDSKDSDDWGVRPDEGYEVALTDDELKQYEKDRGARDAFSDEAAPPVKFQDRQLEKALAWIAAKMGEK
jgi:carboxyl-terminal processing protease